VQPQATTTGENQQLNTLNTSKMLITGMKLNPGGQVAEASAVATAGGLIQPRPSARQPGGVA
jgi:hypothetical protein